MEIIVKEIVDVAKNFRANGEDGKASDYLLFQPEPMRRRIFNHVVNSEDLNTVIFVKETYNVFCTNFNQMLSVFKKNPSVGPWLVENSSIDLKEECLIYAITTKNQGAYEHLRAQKDIDLTCRAGAVLLAASTSALPNLIEDIIIHFSKEDRVCALHWSETDLPTVQTLLKHQIVENDTDNIVIQKGLNTVLVKSVQNQNAALVEFLAPLCDIPAVYQTLRSTGSNTDVLDQHFSNKQKSLLLEKIKTARPTVENQNPIRKI